MRLFFYEQQQQGRSPVIEMTRTDSGVWVAPWEQERAAAFARSHAKEPPNQQVSQLFWHSFRRWWQKMYRWLQSWLFGGPHLSQHTV